MLKNFAELLSSYASGAGLDEIADLGTVKKKGISLTPGQNAVSAIHEGVHTGLGGDGLDTKGKISGLKSLGLISQGISDAIVEPSDDLGVVNNFDARQNPFAQKLAMGGGGTITGEAPLKGNSFAQAYSQPMYQTSEQGAPPALMAMKRGGRLRPGESALVGDGTDDPRAEEVVHIDEDGGGATVVPNVQRNAADLLSPESLQQIGGERLGIQQTENDDTLQNALVRPAQQNAVRGVVSPDPSQLLAVNQPDKRSQLYSAIDEILTQKPSKWSGFKDVGIGIVQGLNNAINNRNDPIIPHSEVVKQRKLGQIMPQLEMLDAEDARKRNETKFKGDEAYRDAQTKNLLAQPEDRDLERQRKIDADTRRYDIQKNTLDWKKEDRDQFYELEDIKNKAREKHDEETFKRADARQKELERHNKITEGQKDTQIGQTNTRIADARGVVAAKTNDQAQQTLMAIDNQKKWTPEQKETARQNLYKLHPTLRPKDPNLKGMSPKDVAKKLK